MVHLLLEANGEVEHLLEANEEVEEACGPGRLDG